MFELYHKLDTVQKIEILQALVAIFIPNIGGIVVLLAVSANQENIFDEIVKPPWTPPLWLFLSVWCSLYCIIGYSSYLVFKCKQITGKLTVINVGDLIVYGINLVFNWSWGLILFVNKDIRLALMDMVIVDVTALLTFYWFRKVKPLAGYLLVPYIIWSFFVTTLNCSFVDIN